MGPEGGVHLPRTWVPAVRTPRAGREVVSCQDCLESQWPIIVGPLLMNYGIMDYYRVEWRTILGHFQLIMGYLRIEWPAVLDHLAFQVSTGSW